MLCAHSFHSTVETSAMDHWDSQGPTRDQRESILFNQVLEGCSKTHQYARPPRAMFQKLLPEGIDRRRNIFKFVFLESPVHPYRVGEIRNPAPAPAFTVPSAKLFVPRRKFDGLLLQ